MRARAYLVVLVLLMVNPSAACALAGGEPCFSPDGTMLASWGRGCTVVLWDVSSGNRIATLYEPDTDCDKALYQMLPSRWISFSPDGKILSTDRGRGSLDLWSVRERLIQSSLKAGGVIRSVQFSPDSTLMLVTALDQKGAYPNSITVWEVGTYKKLLHARTEKSQGFVRVAFSPDCKTVMGFEGTWNLEIGTTKLWDIQTGEELVTLKGHRPSFSPDGKYLIVNNQGLMLWDIKTGNMRVFRTQQSDAQPKPK